MPALLDPCDLNCESNNPAIAKPSGTCDNINNSYSDSKLTKTVPEGKRIDHILFKVSSIWEVSCPDHTPYKKYEIKFLNTC